MWPKKNIKKKLKKTNDSVHLVQYRFKIREGRPDWQKHYYYYYFEGTPAQSRRHKYSNTKICTATMTFYSVIAGMVEWDCIANTLHHRQRHSYGETLKEECCFSRVFSDNADAQHVWLLLCHLLSCWAQFSSVQFSSIFTIVLLGKVRKDGSWALLETDCDRWTGNEGEAVVSSRQLELQWRSSVDRA